MRRTLVTLHFDTFTIEPKPTDHMDLCWMPNPLNAIGHGLDDLVAAEQEYDSGDLFYLPAQTWNGIVLPDSTWTVEHTGELPGIIGVHRLPSTFHVHKVESDDFSWIVVDSSCGRVIELEMSWSQHWDESTPMLAEMLPLYPGDIIVFHPFAYYHPEIPGRTRLVRYHFLPVFKQIEPLTKEDKWNAYHD